MSENKNQFEKWQKEARKRFENLDGQLGISDKVGEGLKAAKGAVKAGSETVKESVNKIKEQAEKTEAGKRAFKLGEDAAIAAEIAIGKASDAAKKAAKETSRDAEKTAETARVIVEEAAENAGDVYETASEGAEDVIRAVSTKAAEVISLASEKAGEVLGQTKDSVESSAKSISKALGFGVSWTRAIDSSLKTARKTAKWVSEQPLQAATTGASLAVGAGLGVVVTGLSSHWLFNSAVPVWTVEKASLLFHEHLKDQETLIAKGKLTKAEAERVNFERSIAKYIGAPLLGAYSFASGAVLMSNIFNPKTITGAPISWLLGANPFIDGVWFFGNGIVCIKTGYEFFMIALDDHDDVKRVVREIKGMLPEMPTRKAN